MGEHKCMHMSLPSTPVSAVQRPRGEVRQAVCVRLWCDESLELRSETKRSTLSDSGNGGYVDRSAHTSVDTRHEDTGSCAAASQSSTCERGPDACRERENEARFASEAAQPSWTVREAAVRETARKSAVAARSRRLRAAQKRNPWRLLTPCAGCGKRLPRNHPLCSGTLNAAFLFDSDVR